MSKIFKKSNKFKLIWRSTTFSIAIWFFCGLVLFGVIRETFVQLSTNKEIEKFKKEIKLLEERNEEMSQLLLELNTSSHLEKESRTKLGLQKEGEHVMIFSGNASEPSLIPAPSKYSISKNKVSNPWRWYIFFKNKLFKVQ